MTGLSNTISITAKISIHTPARGVTEPEIATRLETLISIHTPARGVTVAYLVMFNNLSKYKGKAILTSNGNVDIYCEGDLVMSGNCSKEGY